jgi:hypothetical protein
MQSSSSSSTGLGGAAGLDAEERRGEVGRVDEVTRSGLRAREGFREGELGRCAATPGVEPGDRALK